MLRSLVHKILGFRSRSSTQSHRPDFSDRAFFNFLSQRETAPETLKQAASDFTASRITDARYKVIHYFRSRADVRFFIELDEIPKLAEVIQRNHPTWFQAQMRKITNDLDVGLSIYSVTAPPLKPGFPWHAPAKGYGDDLLYPVRPHRFAFAPRIALVGLAQPILIERLAAIVQDWQVFAAKGQSNLPYVSNLVVIQRLLAVSWTWAFLAARPMANTANILDIEWALIKLMYVDVEYLGSRLGTSYPNNHLLVDQFAGWYISQWLPEFSDSALPEAEDKWLRELQRQILADGTGFEHSGHYHEFGCEMALAYYLLSARNHRKTPEWFDDRLVKMLRFQADICGPHGLPTLIGNTTEDPLFPLDADEGWASAAWWEILRTLFETARPPIKSNDKPCIERAAWLLGCDPCLASNIVPAPESALHTYPDGGFFVFSDPERSCRLMFRTGPAPGTGISAGHMHADLLSLYLSIDDEPVLVDAGTYTYRSTAKTNAKDAANWRQYLVGPSAHNGPTIQNIDPHGNFAGDFRPPGQTARTEVTRNSHQPPLSWVEARIVSANEYDGLVRGVILVRGEYFVVYDRVPESQRNQEISFGFQFSPASKIGVFSDSIFVNSNGKTWAINASPGLIRAPLLEGSISPVGGWVSEEYGNLVSAPQARFRTDHSRHSTAFVICAGNEIQADNQPTVEVNASGNDNLSLRISMGQIVDYIVIRRTGKVDAKDCWGIDFDGDLLWLRVKDARAKMLRWLDGRSARCQDMGLRVESTSCMASLEVESLPLHTPLPAGLAYCELG
jgi:Heparinase II/III-like protein/Heparinase II/III N-terminus